MSGSDGDGSPWRWSICPYRCLLYTSYGHVLDAEGNDTGYLVIVSTENGESMQEIGNLYKEGEYKGNIYMLKNGPDKGELTVLNTTYLWMVYSDDDGATWSDPVDITPQVKKDWMLFLGTGPGVGIQLDNGNLVVPVYHSNSNVGASQSSAVIIRDVYKRQVRNAYRSSGCCGSWSSCRCGIPAEHNRWDR